MVNRVFLIGRVGKKPELQEGQNGTLFCRFSLATDGQKKKDTMWHDVTCFKKTAENVCKFMDKGCVVSVEGSILYSEYTDKDGIKRRGTQINANSVTFITYPDKSDHTESASEKKEYDYFDDVPENMDIPF